MRAASAAADASFRAHYDARMTRASARDWPVLRRRGVFTMPHHYATSGWARWRRADGDVLAALSLRPLSRVSLAPSRRVTDGEYDVARKNNTRASQRRERFGVAHEGERAVRGSHDSFISMSSFISMPSPRGRGCDAWRRAHRARGRRESSR